MSAAAPAGGATPVSTRVANLAALLSRSARRLGDRPALVHGDLTLGWRELDERVDAMAIALRDRFGVVKGDRILVQSTNCHPMFESMFACFRLGAVWVPTNFRQTPAEVAATARISGATGMICHAAFPEHVAACRASERSPRFCIAIGDAPFGESYDALVDAHRSVAVGNAVVDRDDPCWFFFTSGTTGRPKAAVLTHGQMAFVVINHLHDLMPGTGPDDVSLVVAPLSHGAGVHQLVQVAAGATTVLMPGDRFDVPTAWSLVERHRVSNLFTVPTIVKQLVEHPCVASTDHSSLRYVIYAGAPMYREDQKRALRTLGPVLVQYFGLGEVTGNITVLPPGDHVAEDGAEDTDDDTDGDTQGARIGSCGFARTGMDVSIQDERGGILAPGETGEICVAGPATFAGYHENPEANAKAFRDGWFRTGDLGHLDAAGYLFITGRASDMYISGGSNIHPREIEEKLLAHPRIGEVAVLGVPDATWGEVGVAVCVASSGGASDDVASGSAAPDGVAPSADELAAFLDGRLARYKIPKRFVFVDALPRSAYGKITKALVRRLLDERGLLEEPPPAGQQPTTAP